MTILVNSCELCVRLEHPSSHPSVENDVAEHREAPSCKIYSFHELRLGNEEQQEPAVSLSLRLRYGNRREKLLLEEQSLVRGWWGAGLRLSLRANPPCLFCKAEQSN